MARRLSIYVYRWGVNETLWDGGAPSPSAALEELRDVARNRKSVEWSLGSGKAPPYARQIRVGDVVLLYAGSKFTPRGIFAIARAGRQEAEHGELAVHGKNWLLPLGLLPVSSKLADAPFLGFDSVLAPSGPAATLLRLDEPPAALVSLVRWGLGQISTRPDSIQSSRVRKSAEYARIAAQIEELPDAQRRTVVREIESLIRDARLRQRALDLWGPACAACGQVLEADATIYDCEIAHIREVWDGGKDQLGNALPLCRTHHWAFDRHIWSIDPSSLRIVVAKKWRKHPALCTIAGKLIVRPRTTGGVRPLAESVLRHRWNRFSAARL